MIIRSRSAARGRRRVVRALALRQNAVVLQGLNLGHRTAAWLYDRLTEARVRPPGKGHLEDPALTRDLTVARDSTWG